MQRRNLLKLLPAALLVGSTAGAAAVPGRARLLALLGEPHRAAAIGAAFLDGCPGGAYAKDLARMLGRQLGPDAPDRVLRARLAAAVRDDFAASRTVIVQGWVLSETECRLCALAALTA